MLNFFRSSSRETSLITLSPPLALCIPPFSLRTLLFFTSQLHAPIWTVTLELFLEKLFTSVHVFMYFLVYLRC